MCASVDRAQIVVKYILRIRCRHLVKWIILEASAEGLEFLGGSGALAPNNWRRSSELVHP